MWIEEEEEKEQVKEMKEKEEVGKEDYQFSQ